MCDQLHRFQDLLRTSLRLRLGIIHTSPYKDCPRLQELLEMTCSCFGNLVRSIALEVGKCNCGNVVNIPRKAINLSFEFLFKLRNRLTCYQTTGTTADRLAKRTEVALWHVLLSSLARPLSFDALASIRLSHTEYSEFYLRDSARGRLPRAPTGCT